MAVSLINTYEPGHPLEGRVPSDGRAVSLFTGDGNGLHAEMIELARAVCGDRLVVVDVDDEPTTAHHYKVRVLPTWIAWRDGRPVRHVSGAVDRDAIEALLRA